MSTTSILGPDLQLAPRSEPLRVSITAEKGFEQVAIAMALNVARSDSRLTLRKLGATFVVESPPLTPAEEAEVLDRIRGTFVANLIERSP